MTEDGHVVALTTRIEAASAKLVLVGDNHSWGRSAPAGRWVSWSAATPTSSTNSAKTGASTTCPSVRVGRAVRRRRRQGGGLVPRTGPPPTPHQSATTPSNKPWTPGPPTPLPATPPACTPGGEPTWLPSTNGPGQDGIHRAAGRTSCAGSTAAITAR
jgi:hypothetical protein